LPSLDSSKIQIKTTRIYPYIPITMDKIKKIRRLIITFVGRVEKTRIFIHCQLKCKWSTILEKIFKKIKTIDDAAILALGLYLKVKKASVPAKTYT
jgi:hypothetical protein